MPERSNTNRTLVIVFSVLAIAAALLIGALFAKVASENEPANVLAAATTSESTAPTMLEAGSTTVVETRTIHVCEIGNGYGVSHIGVEGDGSCDTASDYMRSLVRGHNPDEDVLADVAADRPECTQRGTARLRCEADDGTFVWLWDEAKFG
ncbi:hypothetical protein KRX51_08170 [Corynebacterium sp. TAE3-ERU12]|uniref:hypothetical protein n=1 Tax=Corynebacterium sp. TAE3-ERU12 TaxID=2849491 RepID=UPI001C44BC73|nr:hypothetical protein [Corynebacterium sp. TAE3-ERU12]MBV7295883.1 hypothetical protein [Corynebacterium sp. TAE3-ERU12]